MKASENKFLTVQAGVVLNNELEETICLLDSWFEKFQLYAEVTSGVRTAERQLRIIKQKAKRHKLFPDAWLEPIELADKDLVTEVWSQVLKVGDIVNPPFPAKNRYEYVRAGKTMAIGRLIGLSPHQRGKSFDISGGENIQSRVVVIDTALASGKIPQLKGFLKEPINNAVHCDIDPDYVKEKDFEFQNIPSLA